MDMRQLEPLLSSYLDGELDTEKTAQVYEQISTSPEAQQELELMKRGEEMMTHTFANHPFDTSLANSIMVSISREEKKAPSRRAAQITAFPRSTTTWLAVAAAILLIITGLGYVLSNSPVIPQNTFEGAPIATLQAKGKAQILRIQGEIRVALASTSGEIQLYPGDQVVNQGQKAIQIRFPDETKVTLAPATRAQFESDYQGKEVVLLGQEGKAFFEVSPQTAPFLVRTEKVTVEVMGTAFAVALTKHQVTTTVTEGKVLVTAEPLSGKSTTTPVLTEGREASYYRKANLLQVHKLNNKEYLQRLNWVDHYRPTPLAAPQTPPRVEGPPVDRPQPPVLKEKRPEKKTDYPIPVKKKSKKDRKKE